MNQETLTVRVNDGLVLNAGTVETVTTDSDLYRRIQPPAASLFSQVLAYLDVVAQPTDSFVEVSVTAIATTAVCLRWGSYLAVLLDQDKPLWEEATPSARRQYTSRVSDSEMARINIESSAALAEWIDIMRSDPARYARLVQAARAHLPMTRWTTKATSSNDRSVARTLVGLTSPEMTMLGGLYQPEGLVRFADEVATHPTRVLANAIINASYRNGPIEDIHAGYGADYPLSRRRITPAEERELMRSTGYRMAAALRTIEALRDEQPPRSWPEQVWPYHHAHLLNITPSGWSLMETSREIELWGTA